MNQKHSGSGDNKRRRLLVVAYQADRKIRNVLDRAPNLLADARDIEVPIIDEASSDARPFVAARIFKEAFRPELPTRSVASCAASSRLTYTKSAPPWMHVRPRSSQCVRDIVYAQSRQRAHALCL